METKEQEGDNSWMKTLSSCANKVKADGYTEDFQVTKKGLTTYNEEKVYTPEQVSIVNFYRFEGASDPGDSTILYVIETSDGLKGTLSDGYGTYADSDVSKFIVQVEEIQKQIHPSKIDV
jgi:hypothetical protein